MESEFQAILDFSQPLNVVLLDSVMNAFHSGSVNPLHSHAKQLLSSFQEHPDSWTRADAILESSQSMYSKFLALQILKKLIETRWKILLATQRDAIRGYVVGKIIELSSTAESIKSNKQFLNKFNEVLVEILKQDWPHNWPTFISEIVSSSRSSVSLCLNNMAILKLLSEEIFDFSVTHMTQTKTRILKEQMCKEFTDIFYLCQEVLQMASDAPLLESTLATLLRFLSWIPLGFIFSTDICELLCSKFLSRKQFRNITIKCLTEIASLDAAPECAEKFVYIFTQTVDSIQGYVGEKGSLKDIYYYNDTEQEFVLDFAMFLTTFMSKHLLLAETACSKQTQLAHVYLLMISSVGELEMFKLCMEYWVKLLSGLYNEYVSNASAIQNPSSYNSLGQNTPLGIGMENARNGLLNASSASSRQEFYKTIMESLRVIMIENMVKPEEVLIVENEDGHVVRESVKELDTMVVYKSLRACLVYLTHLDPYVTEELMLSLLHRQSDPSSWNWTCLNKLCWAIGSISGAMVISHEKSFLVNVIRDLLSLVETMSGKDNKAVVASNIMYVVGQYPRFLKTHWRFLRTVLIKLFEFMHETHEGVREMACDTFFKIVRTTRRQFIIQQQADQPTPFVEDLLQGVPFHTQDLPPAQVQIFYEAVGLVIRIVPNRAEQERMVEVLMSHPNSAWDRFMTAAAHQVNILQNPESVRSLRDILRVNSAACRSIGAAFRVQMHRNMVDMLGLYCACSTVITGSVNNKDRNTAFMPLVKGLRSIKKEILNLIKVYIQKCENLEEVAMNIVPKLLEACLGDYAISMPEARDAEVLHVVAKLVRRLKVLMNSSVGPVLNAVFTCTLEMINKELIEFPEHRKEFFRLLAAIVNFCFPAILSLPPEMFQQVINSIVWGIKHTMREIADVSLRIASNLLKNMTTINAEQANNFYRAHYLSLMQDIFFVLTSSEHRSCFSAQVTVLAQMIGLVVCGDVQVPLGPDPLVTNQQFLQTHVAEIFQQAFQQLSPQSIQIFVFGLTQLHADLPRFRAHVRDFLIQLKEFSGSETDLYLDERQKEIEAQRQADLESQRRVPGLLKPSEQFGKHGSSAGGRNVISKKTNTTGADDDDDDDFDNDMDDDEDDDDADDDDDDGAFAMSTEN